MIPRSRMTTIDVKSTNEISGLSWYFCRICHARQAVPDADDRIEGVVIFFKRADGQADLRALGQRQRLFGLQNAVFASGFHSNGHGLLPQANSHARLGYCSKRWEIGKASLL